MNQFTKRFAIAGICVCMTASTLTGCGVKEDSVVATVDGDEISYALANFVIRYNQAQYEQFYTAYGAYMGLQSGTNVWNQSVDGQNTLGENLKESVLESLKDMYLLEDHMGEYDLTITAEEKKKIEETADAFLAENTPETLEAMSATKENVSRMLELSTIYAKMRSAIYDTVDTEVSDEEAAQRGITTVFFSAEDTADATAADASDSDAEEATAGTAKNEAKEKAQNVLDEIKKGKELDDVLEKVDDTVTSEYVTYGEDDTMLDEEIKAAADALTKEGETAENLVEAENGYYVVQLIKTLDRDATDMRKEEIISERKTEAFESTVEEWKEAADITVKQKTLNKIKFVDSISMTYTEETTPADATAGEAETETEIETESETGAEKETETESETAAETETESETAAETETEKK